jgi:hypothetical protein
VNASVVPVGGVLKIEINGRVLEPLAFRSFRPEERNIREFHGAGVRLMSILSTGLNCTLDVPYSRFGETWVGPDRYDFAPLDDQIALFMRNAPDTYFNLMLQLDTRPWWLASHPECSNTFWNLVEMAAYEPWRRDATAYLRAMIAHTEERYGDRFFAYSLFCGSSTEWYTNSQGGGRPEAELRPHPLKREAFRAFTGDPDAALPSVEELSRTSHGVFRHPVEDAAAVAYWRFHNGIIADTILHFAREAKAAMHRRKLLGLFYGYLIELGGTRLLQEGHLGYEKVLTCPDLDMIFAPAAYGAARTFDGASGFLNTIDSVGLKHKLYIHECDHTTHIAPTQVENGRSIPGSGSKLKDAHDGAMVLRREFTMTCAKRTGLWWFDFFGGYYYDAALMREVANLVRVRQRLNDVPMRSVAEIAVFGDAASMLYVSQHAMINNDCLLTARDELNRLGAPYDLFDFGFFDDPAIPHAQYKLYVFLNAFRIPAARQQLIETHVRRAGRSALWLYAPGYIQDAGFSLDAVRQCVGMDLTVLEAAEQTIVIEPGGLLDDRTVAREYGSSLPVTPLFWISDPHAVVLGRYAHSGKPALGFKRQGRHTAYYSGLGGLPGPLLREIARASGVHIYHEGRDPLFINSRLIGIHMQGHTAPTLTLPQRQPVRLEELFDGGELCSTDGQCRIPYEKGAAKLYLLTEGA